MSTNATITAQNLAFAWKGTDPMGCANDVRCAVEATGEVPASDVDAVVEALCPMLREQGLLVDNNGGDDPTPNVYIVENDGDLNVLACHPGEVRDQLRRLYGSDACADDSIATWRATDEGWAHGTWGPGGGEGLVGEADVPEAVRELWGHVEEARRLGREAGVSFWDEFSEELDPAATDWDSEAYTTNNGELPEEWRNELWPVYQAALVGETRRLCAHRAVA